MAEQEVEEHVHHAHEPFDKLVAGTMASIAALLAIVSVSGTHFNTEQLLKQQQSSDQWAFYQAKDIRRYVADATHDLLAQAKGEAKAVEKYEKDSARYDNDKASIREKAEGFAKESEKAGERAESLHMGEVFLEIGIVLSSLAILTKRRVFYFGGTIAAVVGLVVAAKAYFA